MSELGESVFRTVGFLRGFFRDVSKLVTVVEDAMTTVGLASPWGSGSFWRYSTSYTGPDRWVPSFVARQYVESAAEGTKLGRTADWYAFFVVHFVPRRLGEPVAIWGVTTLGSRQDVFGSFDRLLLDVRGPKFLDRLTVAEWQSVPDPASALSVMRYRSQAVVELSDETMVREVVLQPLTAEIDRVRETSRVV